MKVVYIAGPYTAKTRESEIANIVEAEQYAAQIAKLGCVALCVHSLTRNDAVAQAQTPEYWYAATMELLKRSDAIFLTPNWNKSWGARNELAYALSVNMPILSSIEYVSVWLAQV